jgi:transcriptional antiterminator RfaH
MAFDVSSTGPGGQGGAPERTDRWYAVRAYPRKEAFAKLHLERQGFASFLPLGPAPIKKSRTAPSGPRPFFPSYLFVKFNPARDRWLSINSTFGVIRLVQFGEYPSPAPDGFVEALMARTSPDGVIGFADPLTPGDQVRVLGGPFDSAIGTFERLEPLDRVTVLLSFLAREVRVSLARGAVIAVKGAEDRPG